MPPVEAGKGDHRVYKLAREGSTSDVVALTAGKHYIGVDAIAWYVNKESSWFSKRMASGTLEVKLSGGSEKYQVALGTFELKGGAKTAPVFDRPVLPERNFRGGTITFIASLSGIRKDSVVAGLLKSAASASLGVAAGMVQTATLAGPTAMLGAAGADLVNGVKGVLANQEQNPEKFFDFSGLEFTIKPADVKGPEIFLLMHRGSDLSGSVPVVKKSGELLLPFVGAQVLDDGAWLLLRVRRSDTYSDVREWFDVARKFRAKLSSIIDDVSNGVITKVAALNQFKPSASSQPTIYDEYAQLRGLILNDGVLSEAEAGSFAVQLKAALELARTSINNQNPPVFFATSLKDMAGMLKSASGETDLPAAMQQELKGFIEQRHLLSKATKSRTSAIRNLDLVAGIQLKTKMFLS